MPMHVIPSPAEGIYSLLTRVSFTFINGPASSRAQRGICSYEPRPFLRAATRGSGLESVLSARSAHLVSGFLFARVIPSSECVAPPASSRAQREGSVFTSRDHFCEPRPFLRAATRGSGFGIRIVCAKRAPAFWLPLRPRHPEPQRERCLTRVIPSAARDLLSTNRINSSN